MLFELMASLGKEPGMVTAYQFSRIARIVAFSKQS
jgi:ribosome-associated toxin RatA of RatAB toxin-antitoxin module